MKKKTIIKLIITNLAIIIADSAAVSVLFGNSALSYNSVATALGITVLIMSVIVFFALNYSYLKILLAKTEHVFDLSSVPDETNYRKELTKYKDRIPTFSAQIDAALNQLNSIDQKRENLIEILNRNKSDCPDLLATCDETDNIITQNIRTILNRLTIVSGIDPKTPQAKEQYTKQAVIINQVLEKNYGILDSFDDFLTYTASLKDKIIEEDVGLKAAITALKQLY